MAIVSEDSVGDRAARVTIVIAAQRRPECLQLVFDAIAKFDGPPLEVIVVANGDFDPEVVKVAKLAGARVITESRRGLNRARNIGARAASGSIVAFLDDDGLPDSRWLSAIRREFRDPAVVAVTGKVRPPQTPDADANLIAFLNLSFFGGDQRMEIDRNSSRWFEIVHFGGVGVGANMAFRRSLFDSWKGFDERIGAGTLLHGGEEGTAFSELVRLGHRIVYTPDALVLHPSALPPQNEMSKRYRSALTAQTAYLTLLLMELKGYRLRVLRYIIEGAFRTRRTWRTTPAQSTVPIPLITKWLAYAAGPLLCFRTKLLQRT